MPLTIAKYGQQKVDTSVSYTTKRNGEWDFRDFGAVGNSDGTTGNGTNNDAAWAAALTTIANVGYGKLIIPGGNFRYTNGLDIYDENGLQFASIEGLGQFNSQLFYDNTTGIAIDWGTAIPPGGGSAKSMPGTIRNFSLNMRSRINVGLIGIRYIMASYGRMERIIVNDGETAFFIDGYDKFTTGIKVEQCRANSNKYGFRTGTSFPTAADGHVTDVTFIKCYAQAGSDVAKPANSRGFFLENLNTSALIHCSAENYDVNWQLGSATWPSQKNTVIYPRSEGFDTASFQIIEDSGVPNFVLGSINVDDLTNANRTVALTSWDAGGGVSIQHALKQFEGASRPTPGANNNAQIGTQLGVPTTSNDALWYNQRMQDGTYAWQTLNVIVVNGHAPTDADFPANSVGTGAQKVGPGSLAFDVASNKMYVRGDAANEWTALNSGSVGGP